jgi:2-dehydropantoate 2-reductase
MGTGGLGGFFGVRLAQAGNDVTFIARGAHLEAIQRDGLRLRSPQHGDVTLRVRATSQPNTVGPVDLVLFCVKTYDLDTAAEQARPMVGADTIVVPIQNGVDAVERIGGVLGMEHIVRGVTVVGASIQAPGVIAHSGANKLSLGELSRERSGRVQRLLKLFQDAGVEAEAPPDIRLLEWWKYVGICGSFGATSLMRLPVGPVFAFPETRAFFRGLVVEAVRVAQAAGIEASEAWVDEIYAAISSRAPWTPSSMLTDLLAGRRLELESIQGHLLRLGERHGVPTPLNFAVYAALRPYVDGRPIVPTPP